MFSSHPRALFLLLLLLASGLHAQTEGTKLRYEHVTELVRLYPTLGDESLLAETATSAQCQTALNRAAKAGVPRNILTECVALRALRKADAASMRQLLPELKVELDKFRPEASLWHDKRAAGFMIKAIERVLLDEEQHPGSLARRAESARDKELARTIKEQLADVEGMVTQYSIEKNLQPASFVSETQWRSMARPGNWSEKKTTDALGNAFGTQPVDKPPAVPRASYERLKKAVPDEFWAPFRLPE